MVRLGTNYNNGSNATECLSSPCGNRTYKFLPHLDSRGYASRGVDDGNYLSITTKCSEESVWRNNYSGLWWWLIWILGACGSTSLPLRTTTSRNMSSRLIGMPTSIQEDMHHGFEENFYFFENHLRLCSSQPWLRTINFGKESSSLRVNDRTQGSPPIFGNSSDKFGYTNQFAMPRIRMLRERYTGVLHISKNGNACNSWHIRMLAAD